MPVRIMPTRGLADLRTLAGRADRQTPSYKAYLRVSFLELERSRHEQEITKAQQRLAVMLARCQEIDAEKNAILANTDAAGPRAVFAEKSRGRHLDRPGKRSFRFAY